METTRPADTADFARWTEMAAAMSAAELAYAMADCAAAERAVSSYDATAAGRYADERMTYEQELAARRAAVVA